MSGNIRLSDYRFIFTYEGGLILIWQYLNPFFLLTHSCYNSDPCHLRDKTKLELASLEPCSVHPVEQWKDFATSWKLTATAILPSTCSGIFLYTSREPPANDKKSHLLPFCRNKCRWCKHVSHFKLDLVPEFPTKPSTFHSQ